MADEKANNLAAAQKVLELDDRLAEAYAARGHARLHEWDKSAIDDLSKSIALAPNVRKAWVLSATLSSSIRYATTRVTKICFVESVCRCKRIV